MIRNLLVFALLLVVSILSVPLYSLEPDPSTREASMGDTHPSLADDFASSFSNPAGFAALDPVLRYSALDFRLTGNFWKIGNVFSAGSPEDVYVIQEGTYVGFGMQGPVDIGYVGDGSAWRLLTYSDIDLLYPNLAVQADFIFTVGGEVSGGWGHRFRLSDSISLDFGVLGKAFHVQRYLGEADVVEFGAIIEDLDQLLNMPFEVMPGFGIDAGLIARFGERWTASLSVEDLLTLEFVSYFDSTNDLLAGADPVDRYVHVPIPDVSIGGSWHPNLDGVRWLDISGIYLSFRNLFGGLEEYPVNYFLGLAAGTELVFWDFLSLRAGFSEGMLDVGLGFRFGGVHMDFGFGGEELSNQPGVFSVVDFRFAFSVQTRPTAGSR